MHHAKIKRIYLVKRARWAVGAAGAVGALGIAVAVAIDASRATMSVDIARESADHRV
jgi:hypothetical protein